MQYTSSYISPLGKILLACDGRGLTGLWFGGEKVHDPSLDSACREHEVPVLADTKRWLDVYFSGREPEHTLPIHLAGSSFQLAVWHILRQIPYGKTVTYGEIARRIAAARSLPHMSAQAVGGAVGRNPISIIIPCHRVVGTGGSLTGYAGGLEKKLRLLTLEGVDTSRFFMPKQKRAVQPSAAEAAHH